MASDNMRALGQQHQGGKRVFRDLLRERNVAAPAFRKNKHCVSSSDRAKCFCDEGEEESNPRYLQGFRGKKESLVGTRALGRQSSLPACRILEWRASGLVSTGESRATSMAQDAKWPWGQRVPVCVGKY